MPDSVMPVPSDGALPRPASSWIADVSKPEIIAFLAWFVASFALGLAATLVIVHRAAKLPASGHLSHHFLAVWGSTWGGSLLLLAIIAGLLVFRRATPWDVVLTWPWLVGLVVGAASFFGLSGQMDSGSPLCDMPGGGSCDTTWAVVAMYVSGGAAVAFGGAFVAAATLKRVVLRLRPTR